jgi:hypothetical protein
VRRKHKIRLEYVLNVAVANSFFNRPSLRFAKKRAIIRLALKSLFEWFRKVHLLFPQFKKLVIYLKEI